MTNKQFLYVTDKKTLGAIGDDLRKVATLGIGAGLIGLIVSGDVITTAEAVEIISASFLLWLKGIELTEISNFEGDGK